MYTDNWQELGAKGIEHERSWPDLSLMQARCHVGTCSATLRIPLLFHAKKGLCWISVCPLYGSIVALTLRRHDATTHAPLLATVRANPLLPHTLRPKSSDRPWFQMACLDFRSLSKARPTQKPAQQTAEHPEAAQKSLSCSKKKSSPSLQKVCHSEELGSQVSLIFLGSRFHVSRCFTRAPHVSRSASGMASPLPITGYPSVSSPGSAPNLGGMATGKGMRLKQETHGTGFLQNTSKARKGRHKNRNWG